MKTLIGLFVVILFGGAAYWVVRVALGFGRETQAPGALMTEDAERVNVRSADNVRLLSDAQLRALEELAKDEGD